MLLSLNTNSKKIRIETTKSQVIELVGASLNTNSKKIRIETVVFSLFSFLQVWSLNTNSKKIRIETYKVAWLHSGYWFFKYQFQENKDWNAVTEIRKPKTKASLNTNSKKIRIETQKLSEENKKLKAL